MLLTSNVVGFVPTPSVIAEMVPTVVGARLVVTVTAMVCVALKAPSLAVTVMVAEPAATPLMLTVDPDTLAVAFELSEELAV